MKEFAKALGRHTGFTYTEDLGGTRFDYTKEVSDQKISFIYRYPGGVTKIEIPDSSFLKVSREGLNGLPYLEAYYDFTGELQSVNIWLRRMADFSAFNDKNAPDENFIRAYDELTTEEADYMLEGDVSMGVLNLYYCGEEAKSEDISYYSSAVEDLPENDAIFISPAAIPMESIPQIQFYCIQKDDALWLGFMSNEDNVLTVPVSKKVNFGTLGIKAKPQEVMLALDKVFIAA